MFPKPWARKAEKRRKNLILGVAALAVIAVAALVLFGGSPIVGGCVAEKTALYQGADLIPNTVIIRFQPGVVERTALSIGSAYGQVKQFNTTYDPSRDVDHYNVLIEVPDAKKLQAVCDLEQKPEVEMAFPQRHLPQ